jgi:c-di-GMP-binding flagellar brake protein YcgR
MLGYDDKRSFFRMLLNSPCELNVQNAGSVPTLHGVCKDISATGMSFEVEQSAIELGSLVKVHIKSASPQIPSLDADTKVVRCEAIDEKNCRLGVEILEMK